jgi:hypothetical protein
VGWYLTASLLAATAVGVVLGGIGAVLPVPGAGRAAALAAAAVVVAVVEGRRRRWPTVRRQVNEDWLGRYRGWAYGAGFGAQLGAGVVTIVTTGTVYLTLAAELLCGSLVGGALIGAAFGLVRAVPLLGARGVRSPGELVARQRRLVDRLPAAHRATVLTAGAAAAVPVALMAGGLR